MRFSACCELAFSMEFHTRKNCAPPLRPRSDRTKSLNQDVRQAHERPAGGNRGYTR
jgi:hypothetical protein